MRCDRSPRLSRFDYIRSVGPVTGVRQINADGSPLTKVFRGAASLAYQNYDANGYVGLKALEFLSAGVDQSSTPSYNVTYADGSSNTFYGETRSEEFALSAAGGAPKILAAAKPLLAASRGATRTLSVAPANVARTNAQLVDDISTRAGQWAQRTRQQTTLANASPQTIGVKQHDYARRVLDRYQRIYGDRGLSTEVRYLDGLPWQPGDPLKGSIRLDVVEGPLRSPTAVFDYKFGNAGLTTGRVNQIRAGAGLQSNVPVIEVRP